jgi:hypothetical protein
MASHNADYSLFLCASENAEMTMPQESRSMRLDQAIDNKGTIWTSILTFT